MKRWLALVMVVVLCMITLTDLPSGEGMVEAKVVKAVKVPETGVMETNGEEQWKNLASNLPYETSRLFNNSYPDSGRELTDGRYGALNYRDGKWQGVQKVREQTIEFDLGDIKSVGRIQGNFLQNLSVGIHFPRKMEIYVSRDGNHWGQLWKEKIDPDRLWMESSAISAFGWEGKKDGLPQGNPHADMVLARYVKIRFEPLVWLFIDEVEIWGLDGKSKSAKVLPPNYRPPQDSPGYVQPGVSTGGIGDLVLLYNGWYSNGAGNWTKEKLLPYVSYVDAAGQPQDWLFDGVAFLALDSPSGRKFMEDETGTHPVSTMEDWQWYIDKTFAKDGDLDELNAAMNEAGDRLGQNDNKMNVVLTIPYPSIRQTNFGDVDGDDITENFSYASPSNHKAAYENKRKALKWYINQVMHRWNTEQYDHLELKGFYWLNEYFQFKSSYEAEMIDYASDLVHQHGKKFFWIPYNRSDLPYWMWDELGFDNATLQSNYFFGRFGNDVNRHVTTSKSAREYGMSVEIEMDEKIAYSGEAYDVYRKRLLQYYNIGVEDGYMNAFNAYYQGKIGFKMAAESPYPESRQMYDWTYHYVKGTYSKQSIDD